jgi:hypothetical protein
MSLHNQLRKLRIQHLNSQTAWSSMYLKKRAFLILLTVLDAAVTANMLALAQILALFLEVDRRRSEYSFCVFCNSFGSH